MRRALIAAVVLLVGCDDLLGSVDEVGPDRDAYCTRLANGQEWGWQLDFWLDCMHGHAQADDGGVVEIHTPSPVAPPNH